jgi:hypothetical protein
MDLFTVIDEPAEAVKIIQEFSRSALPSGLAEPSEARRALQRLNGNNKNQ